MPHKDRDQVLTYQREYNQKHYARKKEQYKAKNDRRRREWAAWFKGLKTGIRCSQCGEAHPAVIDFHHTALGNKVRSISMMVHDGFAKAAILQEIEKCQVLCSNCHRRLHWEQEEA
jgi:hypothetical protein